MLDRVPLRGFAVDLVLAGGAALLGWHPLQDFLEAHVEVVYWGVGSVHIVVVSFLMLQTIFGQTRGADLIGKEQGPFHERVYVWSTVLTMGASFIVPFACALMLPVEGNIGFAMAVLFAPFVAFVGPMLLALSPAVRTWDPKLWNPLLSRGGRFLIGAAITIYLALEETTLFLCHASNKQVSDLLVVLGLFLAYLPTRLFLFYNVTPSAKRAEVVSLFASFLFLAVQIASAP